LAIHPNFKVLSMAQLSSYMKSGGWLTFSLISINIIDLSRVIIFTNYGSKELYGSYVFILSIISILVLTSYPGINNSILYAASKGYYKSLISGVYLRIKVSLFGSIILLLISIYYYFIQLGEFSLIFIAISIVFPFYHSGNSYTAYLQGINKFRKLALFQISYSLLSTLFLVFSILLKLSLLAIIISFLVPPMVYTYIFIFFEYSKIRNTSILPSFITMSRNFTITAMLGAAYNQIDKIIIGSFIDLSSLAVYNLSKTIVSPLRSIGVIFNKLIFPKFAQSKTDSVIYKLNYLIPVIYIISVLTILCGYFVLPMIIETFFKNYIQSIFYSQLLIIGASLSIPGLILSSLYFSQKEFHGLYLKMLLIQYIIGIVLLPVFGYYWGMNGIVAFKVFSDLLGTVFTQFIFYNIKNRRKFS